MVHCGSVSGPPAVLAEADCKGAFATEPERRQFVNQSSLAAARRA